jgi:carbon storage regulator
MMLVLSRKIGERVIIADNIEIMIVEIHGNRIRLGVNAPREISVRRAEIPRTGEDVGAPPIEASQSTSSSVPATTLRAFVRGRFHGTAVGSY